MAYQDLPEAKYKATLLGFGLPEGLAALLADSDVGASKGALFDDSRQLSTLIGRPTTPLADSVKVALAAAQLSQPERVQTRSAPCGQFRGE